MKKYVTLLIFFIVISFLVSAPFASASKNMGETDVIGPENYPNTVAVGTSFYVKYLYSGQNATVSFYPLISASLPYEFEVDEYHGEKYKNISDLIRISEQQSNSWNVYPQTLHLSKNVSDFRIKVTLYYGVSWDMFIIVKYPNGTYGYLIHSLPNVIPPKNGMFVVWVSLYVSAIALAFSLYDYLIRKKSY